VHTVMVAGLVLAVGFGIALLVGPGQEMINRIISII